MAYLQVGEGIVPLEEESVGRRGAGPAGHVYHNGLWHQLLGVVYTLNYKELAVQDPGDPVHRALLVAKVHRRSVGHHRDHQLTDIGRHKLVCHGPANGEVSTAWISDGGGGGC